jgi:uncharacterized membrane protein YoaK (UPF0700 family)
MTRSQRSSANRPTICEIGFTMNSEAYSRTIWGRVGVSTPSLDSSPGIMLLPLVLAFVAGSVDVISFLGLDGLFTAHITGNLVVLAAHIIARGEATLALMISVPLFIIMLAATRVLASSLERGGIQSLGVLLFVQFALLCGFLGICFAAGPGARASAPSMILAGMLGVSAMAVQNALVRISLIGAPSTAVLTTNITLLTTDIGEIILGQDPGLIAKARQRARRTWPAVAGFLFGCALGAWCEAAIGLRALVLPVSSALVALALGTTSKPARGNTSNKG